MNDFASIARIVFTGRGRWIAIAIALIGLAPLAYAHRVHLAPWLPYLMLLACPLMHLFMMHGPGGHTHGDEAASEIPRLPPANHHDHDA